MSQQLKPSIPLPQINLRPSEQFRLVEPPSTLTDEERNFCLSALSSRCSDRCATQLQCVETFVAQYALAVPGFVGYMNGLAQVSVQVLKPTKEQYLDWVGATDNGTHTAVMRGLTFPGEAKDEALAVTSTVGSHAPLACMLFAMGRQGGANQQQDLTAPETAHTNSRPLALIRRFDISEDDQKVLPGREAGPSVEYLFQIYEACGVYEEVRRRITLYTAAIDRTGPFISIEMEVLCNNFRLLADSNQTHLTLIMNLIKMHPWTLQVPELASYYAKFADECDQFELLPLLERRYHRLISPQSQYYFRSADYRPLIAVAHALVKEVEQTYTGYEANAAKYSDIIEKVLTYKAYYAPNVKSKSLAEQLGVPYEELPEIPATASKPAEASAIH